MRIAILKPIGKDPKENFTRQMMAEALDKGQGEELEFYVDSPGGETDEGHLMFSDVIEAKKKKYKRIVAIIANQASSAASYLIQAADKVIGFPHSSMLIHEARFNVIHGDLTASALEKKKQDIEATNDQIAGIYAAKTGKDVAFWRGIMAQEKRINAPELLELGLIDEIMDVNRAVALSKEVTNQNLDMEMLENLNKQLASLKSAVKMAFSAGKKNMELELAGGKRLFIYSEDGELEGKRAVLLDAEGMPTEENAPEGTHDLRDGRKIVIGADGMITAVEESELAKAIARAEAAEAKVTELETAVAQANQAVTEAVTNFEALAKKVNTAQAVPTRTNQAAGGEGSFDALDAFARAKGISRADAEKYFDSKKNQFKK